MKGLGLGGRVATALAMGAAAQLLAGCNGFFVYPGSTTSASTTTADYAFVSNNVTSSVNLNAYVVSSGTLVSATNSPDQLGIIPQAMAVTPNNMYLYVVSTTGGLYGFTIGTGGALTVLNGGNALATDAGVSICISPDGNWMFSLQGAPAGATSTTANEYQIQTAGSLKAVGSIGPSSQNPKINTVIVPASIKFAPSGQFLAVALGGGGVETYSFATSSGTAAIAGGVGVSSATNGIYAIGIDSSNYLYAAGAILANSAPGVVSYLVSSLGVPATANTGTALSVGTSPSAIEVNSSNKYVYVACSGTSTIYAFSTTSGTLAALSSVNAPTNVAALGHDASGDYVVAAGYNTASGIQIFSISSTGTLSETNSVASGTTAAVPVAIAMSH